MGRMAYLSQSFDLQGDGGCQPQVVERRGPEVSDDPPGVRDRPPDQLQDPLQVPAASLGIRRTRGI
jgi:hypothetical protein